MEYVDINNIKKLKSEGYLISQKHPDAELYIYNYSKKTQYENYWNNETLKCRGLILDGEGKVVSMALQKFFNLSQHKPEDIPNESFEVFTKMDGSYGASYILNGKAYIASRGSFASDQALEACKILDEKYPEAAKAILENPGKTYIFEIIYPANRIVVDYGSRRELVLLAVIDNATGKDLLLEDIGTPVVERHEGINDIKELEKMERENEEGFVVRFKNGFRLKIKFAEYVRLHRIMTQVSNLDLWRMRMYQISPRYFPDWEMTLDDILEKVPDEFYDWIHKTLDNFEEQFNAVDSEMRDKLKKFEAKLSKENKTSRKDFALNVRKFPKKEANLLMCLKYGSDEFYKRAIWLDMRPEYTTPFMEDKEN